MAFVKALVLVFVIAPIVIIVQSAVIQVAVVTALRKFFGDEREK